MTDEKKQPHAAEPSMLDAELAALESEAIDAPAIGEIAKQESQSETAKNVRAEYYGLLLTILTPLPGVLCPNWNLQKAELETLASAYADACAKQWPDGVGEMGPWAGAALTTAVIVGPRLGTPPRNKPGNPGEESGEVKPQKPADPEQLHGVQSGGA